MKAVLPTLLKALGVVLVSAFVLFLFYPKGRIKDQVVNTALEMLGNKLLAMVPKEKEWQVQREFEAMREQALAGKVDEEHLEQFVTVVLNAEAEGKPLPPERIDSSLAALRRIEVKQRRNEKRLQQWAERMHAFEKFQTRWEWAMADTGWAEKYAPHQRRPFYRVGPSFVVKIDTAALAHAAAAAAHAHFAESLSVAAFPPHAPLPPRVGIVLKEISELSFKFTSALPIELEHPPFPAFPDSIHFEPGPHPSADPALAMPPAPPPHAEKRTPSPAKKRSP